MLDRDLAMLYEVPTKSLNLAVKRNIDRFPKDFMFQLTKNEWASLRFQFETSKRGGTRYLPYAFAELGVAMLSSVLKSQKAIQTNIAIMRTFVMLREYAMNYKELQKKIEKLEGRYNQKFQDIYEVLKFLISPKSKRKPIGFRIPQKAGKRNKK